MRIRAQLVLLVCGAVAPIAALALLTALWFWEAQRDAHEQRFLERVRALRLALDIELHGTLEQLYALADYPGLPESAASRDFASRFPRILTHNRDWEVIAVTNAGNETAAGLARSSSLAQHALDDTTVSRLRKGERFAISGIVPLEGTTRHITYLAAPVSNGGNLAGIVYVGIDHTYWLDFLKRHPIADDATLTLNDADGRIITRTLNDANWVGKHSRADYWDRTVGKQEGFFRNPGLEGQIVYSAFSRSQIADWILGTGVPEATVTAALATPLRVLSGVGILALIVAALCALLIGRRISDSLVSLESLAHAVGQGSESHARMKALAVAEAETVRKTLEEAASALRVRERSLKLALEQEALSRKAAEESEKGKDQLLAMLGHELRNPVSAIKAASMVMDRVSDGELTERARGVVTRQVKHLTRIVDDLLDVARLDTGKLALNRQAVDLSALAGRVLDAFADAGRSAHVRVSRDLQPGFVYGDETRLEQVVANLLDNACKFTPAGGKVAVKVRVVDEIVVLEISDTGAGIPAELLSHVFEVFKQGETGPHRPQGGLGLGLAIVRRLVELHEGAVTATSDGVGQGTCFLVRLPRSVSQSGPSRASENCIEPMKILLADDHEDTRELLSAVLREQGHNVKTASTGKQSLAMLMTEHFDLALLDIGMPEGDGIEVARELRAAGVRVRLFALTGYGRETDRRDALNAGFNAVLIKPFDVAAFNEAVRGEQRAANATSATC